MSALEPVTYVELRQPRCGLRFGVSPCPAVGTPKCYNTWGSCPTTVTKNAFDPTGRIRWRFVSNRVAALAVGDFTDADDPATNAIPVEGLSVSTARSQLNIAGLLDGKSPFGIHATCTISMRDFPWDDHVGDFYLGDRANLPPRMFWAVWTARNTFYGGMEIVIYDGYVGEPLSAMRQRLYIVDNVDGPDASGQVTIRGIDPLVEAEGEKSLFPPAMDVRLVGAITASQTTIRVLTSDETNLSRTLGIGGPKGMRIGSEVFFYTDYTMVSAGVYDLNGCTRGVLNTVAATAASDARLQRIGYFVDTPTWQCGKYLLSDHTPVGAALISTSWDTEGNDYLLTFRSTCAITQPTPVENLMGEICQQGMFFTWWGEYSQKVEMQAVRAPEGTPVQLTTDGNIVKGSAELRREPESLLTRVFVYYAPFDPTKTDRANYRVINGQVEELNERPAAAGKAYTLEILARWVQTEAHAQFLIAYILARYRNVPRFLTIHVSAQDRTITVGDVCDVTTREIVDTEGRFRDERWQVISWAEIRPGEVYLLDMQSYDLVGRFGAWMDDLDPDYDTATAEERETGGFWADDDGLMPDGTEGYQWQ